jgi:hypothetical protein
MRSQPHYSCLETIEGKLVTSDRTFIYVDPAGRRHQKRSGLLHLQKRSTLLGKSILTSEIGQSGQEDALLRVRDSDERVVEQTCHPHGQPKVLTCDLAYYSTLTYLSQARLLHLSSGGMELLRATHFVRRGD